MSFLDQIATHILNDRRDDLEDLIVIFPNVRARIFLTNKLVNRTEKTAWLPVTYSSKEFTEMLSGLKSADDFVLLTLLFEAFSENKSTDIEFKQFLNWGSSLLHDFKEIDQQLADTGTLFKDLTDIRKIELWNAGRERLSIYQQKYLEFSKSLGNVYASFTKKLDHNGIAHNGYVERKAAESISTFKFNPESKFIIAGFNALTRAEMSIFKHLKQNYQTDFFWDYDEYYVNNPLHEAGHFARINKETGPDKNLKWVDQHFEKIQKNVTIYQCSTSIEQAMYLPIILKELEVGSKDPSKTAVVLPDERILIPVLQYLPENIKHVNVTMGYSLIHSPFHGLFDSILRMYVSKFLHPTKKGKGFYYRDIQKLLQEYGFKKLMTEEGLQNIRQLTQAIAEKNLIYLHESEINKLLIHLRGLEIASHFSIAEILNSIGAFIQAIDDKLSEEDNINAKMERAFLQHHAEVLGSVEKITGEIEFDNDFRTIIKMWKHYSELAKIQFSGEPLIGMQIMGLLETRNLDFENVIMLNVNEGVLPANRSFNSMIPNDVKGKHQMLVHRDKEAVFAFHFYRLMQRAKNVHLFYTSQMDDFGGGEKSRFIIQLKKELLEYGGNHQLNEYVVQARRSFSKNLGRQIEKTDEMIEKIMQIGTRGFSPTSISTYLNCPLNFYYKYLVGLRDKNEAEESIEADVLGKILHDTLKIMYLPLKDKVLTKEMLDDLKKTFPAILDNEFEQYFSQKIYLQGKNKLTHHLAVRYLERILEIEAARIKNHQIKVLEVEKTYNQNISIDFNDKQIELKIKGTLDRLESIDGRLQIVDYKTGALKDNELRINEIDELFTFEKNKLLQLMIYTWLVKKEKATMNPISAQIYSFKSFRKGFINAEIGKGETEITSSSIDEIEIGLKGLIASILNKDMTFKHTEDALYCDFC